jgi:uncharacterized protein YprB with RNaseH-like and TPR domain
MPGDGGYDPNSGGDFDTPAGFGGLEDSSDSSSESDWEWESDLSSDVNATARVLYFDSVAEDFPTAFQEDALEYFNPDLVVFEGNTGKQFESKLENSSSERVRTARFSPRNGGVKYRINGVQVMLAPSRLALSGSVGKPIDTDYPIHVLTQELSIELDKTSLSTELCGGREWRDALDGTQLDNDGPGCSHISTEIAAGYYQSWGGLNVYGAGSDDDGTPEATCLVLRGDGSVGTESIEWTRLGVRAVPGVGASISQQLSRFHGSGIRDRKSLRNAEVLDLVNLDGIGRTRAENLIESAGAIEDGRIIADGTGAGNLPDGDPVYIDIETDGLTPTIIWLIGAYNSRTETYHDFLETNPENPAGALVEFASWLSEIPRSQPVIAYNGRKFDFPSIHDHLTRLAPEFVDTWESRYRFDPLDWAKDHARLPGRTNQLKDVSSALGYEGAETGLSGATVGRKYTRWKRTGDPEAELAWDVHREYCEDDVRSLAYVTEALIDAVEAAPGDGKEPTGESTSQGTLTDF